MRTKGTYHLGTAAAAVLLAEVIAFLAYLAVWWILDREVQGFQWGHPQVLWALLAGPVLTLLFLLDMGWRNRALKRFAQSGTLERMVPGTSTTRTVLRFLLLRHGLAFTMIAMAGPQFGTRLEEVKAEGIDLVVAIDVSSSMDCQDLRPSRMEAARRAMAQLIDRMRGDRLGMVVFAGDAFVQLPITTDRSAAKLFLNTVNTNAVGTPGTAIGAAIEMAQESFSADSPGSKAIIVITDGENHEDDAEGAARKAAGAGIVVHTVGMGTSEGGPLPIIRNGQVNGFRKDNQGNTVVSRLNEPMLQRIAAAGNGVYIRATQGDNGIQRLVDDLRSMDTTEMDSYVFTAHEDHFQYPLVLALVMCVLAMATGERRHGRLNWTTKR